MPILFERGRPVNSTRGPEDAWPCEWCGKELNRPSYDSWRERRGSDHDLADDEPHGVWQSPHADLDDYHRTAHIYVQLCGECHDIYCELGWGGPKEMPDPEIDESGTY